MVAASKMLSAATLYLDALRAELLSGYYNEESSNLYQQAALLGSGEAAFRAGEYVRGGFEEGDDDSYRRACCAATFWYHLGAEMDDDRNCACGLGMAYWMGLGVEQDDDLALSWTRHAIKLGDMDGRSVPRAMQECLRREAVEAERERMHAISERNKELSDERKKARGLPLATVRDGDDGRQGALAGAKKSDDTEDECLTRKQRRKHNRTRAREEKKVHEAKVAQAAGRRATAAAPLFVAPRGVQEETQRSGSTRYLGGEEGAVEEPYEVSPSGEVSSPEKTKVRCYKGSRPTDADVDAAVLQLNLWQGAFKYSAAI
jgi:hypothetical protein